MKKTIFISCALLFLGCSDNKTNESTNEPKNIEAYQKEETQVQSVPAKVVIQKVEPVTKEVIETEVTKKIVETKNVTVVAKKSGVDVYQACVACHGQNAEKKALGKSQVIKGWSATKTIDALNGYIDGSYGGTMKGLMKGQVSGLSKDDIEAVSEYISKL